MKQHRELTGVLGALALLAAVSLYRQLSLRFWPGDAVRPWLVCAVYLFLLLFWDASLRSRMTQRNLRLFLRAEACVMLLWVAVRFVQDVFLQQNVYLLRLSGYLIFVPAVAVPLLGFYAAFGLGRGDGYRFSARWYLLLLPAAALIAMALTDERHHFLFRVLADEPQPNLYFHPGYGIILIYAWVLLLVLGRLAVIRRRTRRNRSPLQKLTPFSEPLALLLFCAPYTVASFRPDLSFELIEFSVGLIFIEAASWGLFIAVGLIPVNTQYETVFRRSTAAMQLVSADGAPLARSDSAPALDAETFEALRRSPAVPLPDGTELLAYEIRGNYLVWQKDLSRQYQVVGELRKTAAELQQEDALLRQELRLRSEEGRIRAENAIYNQLTAEVGPQLALLQSLLAKKDTADDPAALFGRICLIGTYVKRRCNLRLIEQSDGVISPEDLNLSFLDLLGCAEALGVRVEFSRQAKALPSAAFALQALDLLEFLLEYEHFSVESLQISFERAAFLAELRAEAAAGHPPAAELRRICRGAAVCTAVPGGYLVTMTAGGDAPCA